jgi:indolepyruvate ferredoxin oxidoreductase
MGDSTFFHSGMVAVSDSIKNNQDITYIILDNGTTAMTGHQPTPGGDVDILGRPTFAQDIEEVVRGFSRRHRRPFLSILRHPIRFLWHGNHADVFITRVNPENRDTYKRLLERVFLKDGVKVVVADKECGITYHRRLNSERKDLVKRVGFLPEERHINITPEVCEYCLECTKGTGCTGLTITETPYGRKIVTDRSSCVDDGACTKIKACPSFEEVILKRKGVPVVKVAESDLTAPLPTPRPCHVRDVWYAYIAGVGGMGVGMVSAILARAGMKQGYEVRFANKKGLAIRNGPVYAHVSFCRTPMKISPVTPYGKADLLLGLDILEAVRGIDPKGNLRVGSSSHTVAVVNTAKTPTITTLIGHDDFDPHELEGMIKRYTQVDRYIGVNLSKLSEQFLGNKLYANIVMLGLAYQRGLLPLDLDLLEWAIDASVRPADRAQNRKAFLIGRHLAVRPDAFSPDGVMLLPTYAATLNERTDMLQRSKWRGKRLAHAYRILVEDAAQRMALDETTAIHLALRVYDLIQYEDIGYAKSYIGRVLAVHQKDFPEEGYAATKAVIRYLYKVMAIKDEVFVAHLLTSEEKRKRDLERYNVDPTRGDRMIYHHLTRPRFTIFGWDIEFSITTRDWQLSLVKRMKWLRRILPEWHHHEKQFRDWYIALVDRFHPRSLDEYHTYLQVLSLPEEVRGYREVRYPKMEEAVTMADQILMSHASYHEQTTVQYTSIGQSASTVGGMSYS